MNTVFRMLAAAALVTAAACSAGAKPDAHASVGHVAPNWTEPTSAGQRLSMDSLHGKPVYLNFFATWCPPCNEEAPDINALQKQYASRGLQVVGIDELEDAKKAAQFVHKYSLVYPAVVDDGTLQTQYSVNGLPVHVFIGKDGVIRKIVQGEMTKKAIAIQIERIL